MSETQELAAPKPNRMRRCARRIARVCVVFGLSLFTLFVALFIYLNRVPGSYPPANHPITPPSRTDYVRFGLDGFESPYLGHTGSCNGKGETMFGGTKANDLDKEYTMGLRWTFTPVNWGALEPDGPVDLEKGIPPAWKALDAFVIEAQKRRLNILMQAPVVGGNAEGPPEWAGRREPGKSAPANIEPAANFAAKLAGRYRPGGLLAMQQKWGTHFGVRAWELDNEPEMYRTHWKGQGGDYAEFATKVAAQIRKVDPLALILLPGVASGGNKAKWLESALDARSLGGSPAYRKNGVRYSIGPVADVINFHVYEGLDSAFSKSPRTIEVVFDEIQQIFQEWETRSDGFHYVRKSEYWHTEGNFDFIGALAEKRRAAWRMQFFTRAFAAGVRKVCVMDASNLERIAVKSYVEALPWPFPMEWAARSVKVLSGQAAAFLHKDGVKSEDGQVWVLWAVAGTGDALVEIPFVRSTGVIVSLDGTKQSRQCTNGFISLRLLGDKKMAPPVLIVDRKAEAI
jgi:hypothetical protein